MSIRIRNGLTRKDSSVFEKQYVDATKKDSPNRHNYCHNYVNLGCPLWIKIAELQQFYLVGTTGFEPATPSSRTRCSTRLSHVPIT